MGKTRRSKLFHKIHKFKQLGAIPKYDPLRAYIWIVLLKVSNLGALNIVSWRVLNIQRGQLLELCSI